jgi:hypothetical protein
MSAGATLAALDEEIGDIVFTVGPRYEGVVVTGKEELVDFSTEWYLTERTLREADLLYRNGAFAAAAKLLERWKAPDAVQAAKWARLCHEWQRLNYRKAADIAASISAAHNEHLDRLARAGEDRRYTEDVLADLIRGADDLRGWGDHEEAAARYYKVVEYAARMRLAIALQRDPPFRMVDLHGLPADQRTLNQLRPNRDGTCTPGLALTMELLVAAGDPMALMYRDSREPSRSLSLRNDTMHDVRPILPEESRMLCMTVHDFLKQFFEKAFSGTFAKRPETLLSRTTESSPA